jgi:hypothetical protein
LPDVVTSIAAFFLATRHELSLADQVAVANRRWPDMTDAELNAGAQLAALTLKADLPKMAMLPPSPSDSEWLPPPRRSRRP